MPISSIGLAKFFTVFTRVTGKRQPSPLAIVLIANVKKIAVLKPMATHCTASTENNTPNTVTHTNFMVIEKTTLKKYDILVFI